MNGRKAWKEKSRRMMKAHYWRVVAVSFLVAFLAGNYNGTFTAILSYDSSKELVNVIQENILPDLDNYQGKSLHEILIPDFEKKSLEVEAYIANSPYQRGVFASLFNHSMATGSVFSGVIAMLLRPVLKGHWYALFSAAAGVVLLMLWWCFVRNVILVGSCRFYLELVTYEQTGGSRIFFLYRIRRVCRIAGAMLRRYLYQWLWSLTIIGGWIKHYSYMMVPYLLAENPELTGKKAIAVSREMMRGHKREAFLLDCSFLGWTLLSIVTLGLVNMLYTNPYRAGAKTMFYLELRERASGEQAPYIWAFTDRFLTTPPTEEELRAGLCRAAAMADRPDWQELVQQTKEQPVAVSGTYPSVLYFLRAGQPIRFPLDYQCCYGLTGLILLFFLFSGIGWLWEVALHLIQTGQIVNRGVLHGPWLPIYGFGGVLVLVALKKIRNHPVATFLLSMLLCGILEYATSYVLEQIHGGVRWWDYSGYFLNLNGRICAEGLVIFGLGCCAFIYILAPFSMTRLIRRIPFRVRVVLCVILICAFAGDFIYTRGCPNVGAGISKEIKSML